MRLGGVGVGGEVCNVHHGSRSCALPVHAVGTMRRRPATTDPGRRQRAYPTEVIIELGCIDVVVVRADLLFRRCSCCNRGWCCRRVDVVVVLVDCSAMHVQLVLALARALACRQHLADRPRPLVSTVDGTPSQRRRAHPSSRLPVWRSECCSPTPFWR